MCIDQHRQHAQGLVVLDEAHAAHVGRQVVDGGGPFARRAAGVEVLQVGDDIVHFVEDLIPLVQWLDVDGPDSPIVLTPQFGDQVASDKSATSGDDDQIIIHGLLTSQFWFVEGTPRSHMRPHWNRNFLMNRVFVTR